MKRMAQAEMRNEEETFLCVDMQRGQPYVFMSNQAEHLFAIQGKTFHFAARFFPKVYRPAVVTLYAFFRLLDDLVDERSENWSIDAVRQELQDWQTWLQKGCVFPSPREPLGTLLATVIMTHRIPVALFADFLQGLFSDLEPREFATFEELATYCYQAAGTVGLAMAHLLSTRSPQALMAARHLGIAMQLTNILRDVGGDLAHGRIYLPQDELARFGLSSVALHQLFQEQKGIDERFRSLMCYQVKRAHLAYQAGLHGCWLLARECRLPVLLAGRLYQRILLQIEQQGYDVLHKRAATSLWTKAREAGLVFLLVVLWQRGEGEAGTEEKEVFYEN